MTNPMVQLQEATVKAQCKQLRMPVIAAQFRSVAEQAVREKKSHIGYLEALMAAELEERERNTIAHRIKEAHLPRVKTLEEFDYTQSPNVSAAKMREVSEQGYLEPPPSTCNRTERFRGSRDGIQTEAALTHLSQTR